MPVDASPTSGPQTSLRGNLGESSPGQVAGLGSRPLGDLLRSGGEEVVDIRKPVGIIACGGNRYAINLSESDYAASLTAVSRSGLRADGGSAEATLIAVLPAIYPEWLGGRQFTAAHNCRFPYVVGAMARGITTARMVTAACRHGLLSFFGAAGLRPPAVAAAIAEIASQVAPGASWGSNLIHSPDRPERESQIVDLYLEHSVARVSASAFMRLSPEVVRYAANGVAINAAGKIERTNHVFAKISRPQVAAQFMAPPPHDMLRELAAAGRISEQQAELQSRLPVAEDITVEADSGGHTDNRPLTVLFPVIAALRDDLVEKHGYERPIRLGAAGGLGSPEAVAAAFQLGADYVLTGSVNQAAVESGLALPARKLLADCDFADVMMAPAADMFERGVRVQVLKKGTMFPVKAQRLYEIYRSCDSLEAISERDRDWLETHIFMETCAEAWKRTRAHYAASDPARVAKADTNAKQRMALLFRTYLFMGSQWAREGSDERRMDYQIWCGPAMGSFNGWVRGSFLEQLENRTVGQIALNLLEGACHVTRVQQVRAAGVAVRHNMIAFTPRPIALA